MGICLSNEIKAETTETDTSNSNSKMSSGSVAPVPRSEGEILQSSNLISFTFNQLRAATRKFSSDSILGGGGFGYVFKGWIDEQTLLASKPGTGIVIAVKMLNQQGLQGHREWLTEINYLGQLRHPNLVRLIGYCLEDDKRLLVYEFMPNGSMENHLFRRGSDFEPLSWSLRMKVAVGAARGLAFLHNAEISVICRDFKTANILLDSMESNSSSSSELVMTKLTGKNFAAWEFHFRVFNQVKGLFEFLDGTSKMPTDATQVAWITSNTKVIRWMVSVVSDDVAVVFWMYEDGD